MSSLFVSDKYPNSVLLVPDYPNDFRGYQQSTSFQLEDCTCSCGCMGLGLHVHDQRDCFFWKGKMLTMFCGKMRTLHHVWKTVIMEINSTLKILSNINSSFYCWILRSQQLWKLNYIVYRISQYNFYALCNICNGNITNFKNKQIYSTDMLSSYSCWRCELQC